MSDNQNTALEIENTIEHVEVSAVEETSTLSEVVSNADHDTVVVETEGIDSDDCETDYPVDHMEAEDVIVVNATQRKPPRNKSKRNRNKAPASDSALHELVEHGITGKGLSTVTSRIKYIVVDDFRAIMNAMTRVDPDPARVEVLTHCHNCIHTAQGFTNVLFNAVPKLREADVNTTKSDTKIGTFSTVAHSFKLPRTDTHVQRMFNTLYTQFCHYQPKRGNPRDNKHVDLKAFRRGFRQILKTYPSNTMHGLVIFGDDKIYPTNWAEIEDVIEEVLEQQDTTLTVFVPRSYAVTCTQKLDGKLAPFLRKVGLYL